MDHVDRYLPIHFSPGRGTPPVKVRHLIVHTIEGSVPSADATFRKAGRNASTHDGVMAGAVWLWVRMKDTAWGAGVQAINRAGHNMETDGYARDMNRPAVLLNSIAERIAEVLNWTADGYDIPKLWTVGRRAGVKGHGDITPDRRWDPGAMDVGYLTWKLARLGVVMDWDSAVILKPPADSAPSVFFHREAWMVHYVQRVVGATVDGLYGNGTAGSVKQYQTKIGVTVDGKWGPGTWAKHMARVATALDKRYPVPVPTPPTPPTPPPPPPPAVDDHDELWNTVNGLAALADKQAGTILATAKTLKQQAAQISAAHDKIRDLQANKSGIDHGPTHVVTIK